MTRPIVEPSPARETASHGWREFQLERRPGPVHGRWIYVGTYPGDPGTTPDSPPFQNGWANDVTDPAAVPLRFRGVVGGGMEIEGVVSGGVAGTVVFTLPSTFVRATSIWLVGSNEVDDVRSEERRVGKECRL